MQKLYCSFKRSDVVMSVFYSPVLTISLILLQLWTAVSLRWVCFHPIS